MERLEQVPEAGQESPVNEEMLKEILEISEGASSTSPRRWRGFGPCPSKILALPGLTTTARCVADFPR